MVIKYSYGIEEALTPIDGRNKHKLTALIPYLSDLALDKNRILVEIKYLQKLSEYKVIRKLKPPEVASINRLIEVFDKKDYQEIRKIELTTNHEMKAVERFIRLKISKTSLKDIVEMIHFGLTTDDVNNIAYALMIKNSLKEVIIPHIALIKKILKGRARAYRQISMLSRTHGQPAVPTTLGKEFLVYFKRMDEATKKLNNLSIRAKLTGNVGNLNAHKFLFPKIDWLKFSREFIADFGLEPDLVTTQIEPYDSYINIFQNLLTINNQLIGLCQDMWIYIMLGYFKQKVIKKEVGSTALPHKVNPIYFEGAEGGFGVANSLFEFYSRKLPHTRLQRDLSDSTVRRSVGIALAYSLLSYQSVKEGLERIEPNLEKILDDLKSHWEILSEAVQNFLRIKRYKDAYEKTKQFFRGKVITQDNWRQFVDKLKLNREDREILLKLTPEKYSGYAEELVDKFLI